MFSSLPKWRGEEGLFWKVQKGGLALGCHKRSKVSPFVKFETILPLLCFLLDPLANKYCRTWISMINLWIDSKTCQKLGILLSGSQRSNNYLGLSKENVLEDMMLSHWPCFTWKILMMWFPKILKLIFQKLPLSPKDICTEHWRKLTNLAAFLEIFLYL